MRRVTYRLVAWIAYYGYAHPGASPSKRELKKQLKRLWRSGPGHYATDDLEMAAVLHFLAENLRWP
ncbi:MAG: hypothetical protein L0Z62_36460 [Gemmataceae bacterium]|nr:hypothetical protein [Gemmataceae bacterium]